MEVTFTHPIKLQGGRTVDVEITASYDEDGMLAWGIVTPQSATPSKILSAVLQDEALIDREAEERIAERMREAREERRREGPAGERESA